MINTPLTLPISSLASTRFSSNTLLQKSISSKIENKRKPEVLIITTYPPRECGIATYSNDLIKALNNTFNQSFSTNICPVVSDSELYEYTDKVEYTINTDSPQSFVELAYSLNKDDKIKIVLIQHEFGLFSKNEEEFIQLLDALHKPTIIAFHTVLPNPDNTLKEKVQAICKNTEAVIVMTNASATILMNQYDLDIDKIKVIPHGTHLVPHLDKKQLKAKYNLDNRTILSTFGLLSSGKNIETTLNALPAIVKEYPDVLFLIIGKTHPSVVKNEGEVYRDMLKSKIETLALQKHVQFINQFLPLPELLEYLQLTDIYLFTSKDPNQAVSGTFSYAISCGCPIISTGIPHAKEVLKNDAGILIDFENTLQLQNAIRSLLQNDSLRKDISSNALHRMASTVWENSAIAHALLFEQLDAENISISYNKPAINLDHFKKLTTHFGMIQFSKINEPDMESGYTLDDNARALIAMCQHFENTLDEKDVSLIHTYLYFIKYCLQPGGYFLNYVNEQKEFTEQNQTTNLADSNGRAIWALGYLISISKILPDELGKEAEAILNSALLNLNKIHSTRAMAFIIKGLYYANKSSESVQSKALIIKLASRLVQMYKHETENEWHWFESYLTYANSILPEALLLAYKSTGNLEYKAIAQSSFQFLLNKTFNTNNISVVSNINYLHKGKANNSTKNGGEQPIDIAYSVMTLSHFYEVFNNPEYQTKMDIAFNWFLGANHLHQIIYNPCTGGCYDGLEERNVNLNQGAESTVSYLMARLTMDSIVKKTHKVPVSQYLRYKIF